MTITIENEYEQNDFKDIFAFDYQKTAEDVIRAVLESENCPYEGEADILLLDSARMRELNMETRRIDKATDVLSFPMFQYKKPADFSELAENHADNFDPGTDELLLGDIVISVPKVKAQAEEYGHSCRREFAFLIAHSTLHLLGYDHMEKEEEKIMGEKQEKVLSSLGITRNAEEK